MSRAGRTDFAPRFGAIDALILGLAIAVGGWLAVTDLKVVEATLRLPDTEAQDEARVRQVLARSPNLQPSPTNWFERARVEIVRIGAVLLPCLTLGVAVVTFRHRECRSRRGLRRVGVLTSAVAGVGVAFLFGSELAIRWTFPQGYYSPHQTLGFDLWGMSLDLSLAITALWGVLAIGGRWKATPDWPDRWGRAVGVAWVTFAVLGVLVRFVGLIFYRADGSPC